MQKLLLRTSNLAVYTAQVIACSCQGFAQSVYFKSRYGTPCKEILFLDDIFAPTCTTDKQKTNKKNLNAKVMVIGSVHVTDHTVYAVF